MVDGTPSLNTTPHGTTPYVNLIYHTVQYRHVRYSTSLKLASIASYNTVRYRTNLGNQVRNYLYLCYRADIICSRLMRPSICRTPLPVNFFEIPDLNLISLLYPQRISSYIIARLLCTSLISFTPHPIIVHRKLPRLFHSKSPLFICLTTSLSAQTEISDLLVTSLDL